MKTMAGSEIQILIEKLDTIKLELDYIKEHMVDVDTVLTPEEGIILEKGIKEYKEGKTISLEDFKKKRG